MLRWVVLAGAIVLSACAMRPPAAVLSADDRTALAQVSAYMDGLQRFAGDFSQVGPQGEARGFVWVERPGRLRVEYYRPGPRTILAAAGRLLVADPLTHSTTTLPVSRTPLDILLAQHIPLSGPVVVSALERQPDGLQVSLVKAATPGQGTLTLRFSDTPLALTGVTVRDRNDQVTVLDLHNLVRDPDFGVGRFEYAPR